jgi:hypothetical protein
MRMPFGKYKGVLFENIPTDYLRWVLRECQGASETLKGLIRDVLLERQRQAYGYYSSNGNGDDEDDEDDEDDDEDEQPHSPPPPANGDLRQMVKEWFASLARDYHPDRTGDNGAAMKVVNEAYERLRKRMGLQ